MDEILQQYPEYRHALRIWKSFPLVFIVFGTFGNLLTIIVLMRRRSRFSSTAMYLTALSAIDLLVLYTGLLRQWIKYVFDKDLRDLSIPGCKLHIFLVYFGTQGSSWMLVAVTIERFIGVWCPHRVKSGCTPRTACVVIASIFSVLFVLNVHWFYGMGETDVQQENTTYHLKCYTMYDDYDKFLQLSWPWIDLCIFCLLPFIILLIANLSIIGRVLHSRRKTRTQIAPQGGGISLAKREEKKTSQLTVMLLTVNVVFFICVTPISIYLIGEPYWINNIETYEDLAVLRLWWSVVNLFMYLNNTLNFVLYFLSGSRFRGEVKALFFGGRSHSLFGGVTATGTTRIIPDGVTPMRSIQTIQATMTSQILSPAMETISTA